MITMEIDITKEDCTSYEDVRISGITNMFMVDVVCDHSGLSKEKVTLIMSNYEELNKKFNFRK